jgi:hypothetical protein
MTENQTEKKIQEELSQEIGWMTEGATPKQRKNILAGQVAEITHWTAEKARQAMANGATEDQAIAAAVALLREATGGPGPEGPEIQPAVKLHLYDIGGEYLVEDDDYRLLAQADDGFWGFTENSDLATVFETADEAFAMARMWDPTANEIQGRN